MWGEVILPTSFYINFGAVEPIELNILGCGSALPTSQHLPSCQVLAAGNKLYMIDCGEGTQLQYRRAGLSFTRLRAIFISHIHGDHCFGLPGLLSTFALLGRKAALSVYVPDYACRMMEGVVKSLCGEMPFEVEFIPFSTRAAEVIYDDTTLSVTAIPLKHRLPCAGFLFKEHEGLLHLDRWACDRHGVPMAYYGRLKNGCDYVADDGTVIPNALLTTPRDPVRSYAYCSDTVYRPQLVELVAGIDLLYHEATFAEADAVRARETFHSTARQAAQIAKDAGAGRLLLGHYSARYKDLQPLLDEAREVFHETYLSQEGMKLRL